ncbi:MAG TPA: DNA-3-methyladenine glycosylase [Candidatus Sulfotelmatobacter sp.]|nr:DNA-3-methyladenine glycosylase [Candidatus Sulfotelmatobacter sp.]
MSKLAPSKHMVKPPKLLRRAFFNRDPRTVSRDLLGKLIVRMQGKKKIAGRIVEVEAYLGADDLAAHSAAGRTERNAALWGPPGHAYVYFIYGIHHCLNISCLPSGRAGCVLIRALEPVTGIREMASARSLNELELISRQDFRKLSSGPGRLCEALRISRRRDNGKDMVSAASDLQVQDDGYKARKIAVTPRIGITKSAEMPLRYLLADNFFVSRK